jgi:hypothetical protein
MSKERHSKQSLVYKLFLSIPCLNQGRGFPKLQLPPLVNLPPNFQPSPLPDPNQSDFG